MDNLEYIEEYFNEQLSAERKSEFEQKVAADRMFAEEIAFYLSSKQAAATEMIEKRERFKELYTKYKQDNRAGRQQATLLRKLWPWAAAAAVLAGIVFGLSVWLKPVSPTMLADKYLLEHLQTLPVTMGNKEDSLQSGFRLYNDGQLKEALKLFETMALNDTSFFEAKRFAGIVSLRLGQYDKAINYFSQLEGYTQLYSNPGKFYHALTLMKRNQPGDEEAAKKLLQQVVENDLERKQDAKTLLDKW